MKNSISIFFIFVIVASANCDLSEGITKMLEECSKGTGISEKLYEPHGPPNFDDPEERCFYACIIRSMGKMENGKINPEKAYDLLPKVYPDAPENAEEILMSCIETANKEDDECDVAGTATKCIHEKFGPPPRSPKE